MKKRPFLLFLGIVSTWVALAIWFIQSPRFAVAVKKLVAQYVPGDIGISADFSEFAVKLFPPGLSVKNPSIVLRERNILKMPAGTTVRAERLDLIFQPIQMFSGDIRIHEVIVQGGEATVLLSSSPQKKKTSVKALDLNFHWDELFHVRAEAVGFVDTKLHLIWKDPASKSERAENRVDFLARSLRLSQWSGKGGLGYEASADLAQVVVDSGASGQSEPLRFDEVKALARINRMGAALEELGVKSGDWAASTRGKIKGDILNPKEQKTFEAELKSHGDLQQLDRVTGDLARGFGRFLGGQANFTGKIRGNLGENWPAQLDTSASRILQSLRAEGRLEIEGPRFREWRADQLQADGSWTGSPEGGELSISRALIRADETPPRLIPGSEKRPVERGFGGEVEVGAFKVNLAAVESLSIPVNLKRAHIHWLAAPVIKELYPLLFRASGSARIKITPAAGRAAWSVQTKLSEVSLLDFQLDNQKPGVSRPLHRILNIPKINVDGDFIVDPEGFRPNGLTASLDRSKFKIEGKIDFASSFWDMRAGGNAELSEIGEIAESAIAGQGPLNVHIHGPGSSILLDFDADLQNAFYLNMHFGNLKGRITWDDDPSRLLLTGLQLRKEQTSYQADGTVDLGKQEKILIKVKIPEGDIRDVSGIFTDLTKDFWWYPRSLTGIMSGEVTVSGGVGTKELQVLARVNGRGWDYLNEKFDQVDFVAGYDRGRYYIQDLKAGKRNGRLGGRISYDANQVFEWGFQTRQLSLNDLDRLAQLDVPMRGRLSIESSGKGKLDAIQSVTRVTTSEMSVRGQAVPPSRLTVKTAGGRLDLQGNAFEGQGLLEVSYDFNPGGSSFFRGEMKKLDFTPLLLLLNPRTIPDPAVAGSCSGSMNLNFRSGAAERANGQVELTHYSLTKTGAGFHLVRPVSFQVNDGSFELKNLTVAGNRGETSVSLRGHQAELHGSVTGALDVSIAEFLTSTLSQTSGVAQLDFAIGGTLKRPSLFGQGRMDGVSFRVPAVESPFENLTGTFIVRQNNISLQDFQVELAGGRVTAGGGLTLFADRYPEISLHANLSGNKIKVFPFQFAKVRGNLKVNGDSLPYSVDGSVVVDSALSKETVMQQKAGPVLSVSRFTPPPSSRRMSDYPKFKLNIDVRSDGGILVQNDLFDAELKAQVKVVNNLEAPRILGTVDLVQGRMLFKDRKFQIQSASAVFDNPTLINPRFNLTATTDVSWVKVQLYASGRISATGGGNSQDGLKLELSSTPVMQQSEIISLLAMGMTPSETKRLKATERTVYEQGEAASLLLHSLDFNRELESKTGLEIQLDESVDAQQTTSVSRPQSNVDLGAAPKIVIKKKLNKNVDISYGSTLGVGTSTRREVNAEVKVTPGFSVIGVWNSFESTTDSKDKQTSYGQTSYGMDLKVQKRFK